MSETQDKLRVHMRFDGNAGEHSHVSLFIGGALCGNLVMRQCEARALYAALANDKCLDFRGTGSAPPEPGAGDHICSACRGTGRWLPATPEENDDDGA